MAKYYDFQASSTHGKCKYDTIVCDSTTSKLVYISFVAYSGIAKATIDEIQGTASCIAQRVGTVKTDGSNSFDIYTSRPLDGEFMHVVACKRDKFLSNYDDNTLLSYIFYKDLNDLHEKIYNKLYKNTAVPILKEWIPYLVSSFSRVQFRQLSVMHGYDKAPFMCAALNVTKQAIIDLLIVGLKDKHISIGTGITSDLMKEIAGMDQYLNAFGTVLASKIQKSFRPKFMPGEMQYDQKLEDFDDYSYYSGIELYDAQKSAIQAAVNHLKDNRLAILVGEMGIGKTAMACGVTYAASKSNSHNSLIMCPTHLVQKWKREIETTIPHAEAYIIHSVSDLLALDSKIRDNNKNKSLYVIMSKEIAKFGYDLRPSAIWSESKKCFVCPDCGQRLFRYAYEGTGRRKIKKKVYFTEIDMRKPLADNLKCPNTIQKWDSVNHKYIEKPCQAKLWIALTHENLIDTDWVKLGSDGWYLTPHLQSIYNSLERKEKLTRQETNLFLRIKDAIDLLAESKSISARAPRKYPIASYIKKFYKNCFDFLMLDEIHQLKGDTCQGEAFGDLTRSCKKTIGLTGTLLNGYADGLFYILFRTMPKKMKTDGFKYSNALEFTRQYGVIKKVSRAANGSMTISNSGVEKKMPGISPLVFTKFLLENSVFISLSDVAEGMVPYTEIPVPITMDRELADAYAELESNLRTRIARFEKNSMKIMSQVLPALSVFPDMPYDQPPIKNPDTFEIIVQPRNLEKGLRTKDQELFDIASRKVEAGEKVLVYYHWTGKTDLAERFMKMFADANIKAAVLESKVAPEKREEWIEKKIEEGIQVLICNPTLVETGLDLLHFTTIIFYQVGYNIYTMRQASRRSWRLSQTKPVEVYFLYYRNTVQEQALSLMATKLQASMAIEGKFSEEGLRALSNNQDILTQIANSVVNGIKENVSAEVFQKSFTQDKERIHKQYRKSKNAILYPHASLLHLIYPEKKKTQPLTPAVDFLKDMMDQISNVTTA